MQEEEEDPSAKNRGSPKRRGNSTGREVRNRQTPLLRDPPLPASRTTKTTIESVLRREVEEEQEQTRSLCCAETLNRDLSTLARTLNAQTGLLDLPVATFLPLLPPLLLLHHHRHQDHPPVLDRNLPLLVVPRNFRLRRRLLLPSRRRSRSKTSDLSSLPLESLTRT